MKYIAKGRAGLLIIGVSLFSACQNRSVKPDKDFDVSVDHPMSQGVRVTIDQGHNNHHRIDGTYEPFARLLTHDGCVVRPTDKPIDKELLATTDILVIATAMGEEDPGIESPFTETEINTIEDWVRNGGSALLVTEHYPFGLAMTDLLGKFGVGVHNGYTEDSLLADKQVPGALLFQKSRGHLGNHPVTRDLDRIYTFTGAALRADSTWTSLLSFSDSAQNFNVDVTLERREGDVKVNVVYAGSYPAKGYHQGICTLYGKGRIVVFAESALFTAQVDGAGLKYGMNIPGADNKQFALNIIRWLGQKEQY